MPKSNNSTPVFVHLSEVFATKIEISDGLSMNGRILCIVSGTILMLNYFECCYLIFQLFCSVHN